MAALERPAAAMIHATPPWMRQAAPATTRARALERVREIVLKILGTRDARVYLSGSSATGRVHRWSDIDVGIDPVRSLPPALLASGLKRATFPTTSTSSI
jgi:predicted nucleotidyltransferase